MMDMDMPPTQQPPFSFEDEKSSLPNWSSYLYQNFLVPAFSPTATFDWLNTPSLHTGQTPNGQQQQQSQQQPPQSVQQSSQSIQQQQDYFGLPASTAWAAPATAANVQRSLSLDQPQQPPFRQTAQPGPSSFYPQPFFYNAPSVINTSLLTQSLPPSAPLPLPAQQTSTDSVNIIETDITHTRSPSPLSSHVVSPHESPILRSKLPRRGNKRSHSVESDLSHSHDEHDHEHDHEPEVPEGVERDGMIWGMKVEDYRALSARERKRVRNRISARTFRAKRKEHLSSLEHTLGAKDLQIKLANEETVRLRREVAELKKRLAKYEKPYDRPL